MSKFKIDHQSATPIYQQLSQYLRELMLQEQYQQGALLPKEVDLAEQLEISRNTVRQAINQLVVEGLLVRKKGVGTSVVQGQGAVMTKLKEWHSFTHEMNEAGRLLNNRSLEIDWVSAPEECAAFFQLERGASVLCLKRLREIEGRCLVYFESYFHPALGLTGQEDFNRSLYEILEQDLGIVPAISAERIQAVLATKALAAQLDIPRKGAVLKRVRQVKDRHGAPIEYNVGYYQGNAFVYEIDIHR
ncbi:GntR family transcriptional regulator [Persicobacter psychrovividus]|uniref:Transcriptional regulator n=1 Tax=Persicobacter psychrovividus TaxID=387638 RepID=A0ABN6LCZ9_9BACT|nr:transcriptional regulator [Persicobacter psychrovividus]